MSAENSARVSGVGRPPRIDFVDGIRALAALYVVLHHIWLTTYPNYLVDPGPLGLRWLAYGNIAVSVFIVVSGFSLSIAPARRDWGLKDGVKVYLQRRAWRILPTFWAALALSCIVFGLVTPDLTGDKVSLKAIIVHGLLLQDVINSPKPNGAFWSIAVEWQIYFLFPLFLWIIRRWGVKWLILLVSCGIVLVYLSATSFEPLERLLNVTPQFVALFVMGIGAAHFVKGATAPPQGRWLVLGASLLSGLFVTLCITMDIEWIERQYFWIDFIAGGATACLLACLVPNPRNPIRRLLASGPLRSTGMYSYSIYCVHLPILWLTWHFLVTRLTENLTWRYVWLTVIGVPVVLAGSYIFSLVFERPFLTHRSFRSLGNMLTLKRSPDSAPSSTRASDRDLLGATRPVSEPIEAFETAVPASRGDSCQVALRPQTQGRHRARVPRSGSTIQP